MQELSISILELDFKRVLEISTLLEFQFLHVNFVLHNPLSWAIVNGKVHGA